MQIFTLGKLTNLGKSESDPRIGGSGDVCVRGRAPAAIASENAGGGVALSIRRSGRAPVVPGVDKPLKLQFTE